MAKKIKYQIKKLDGTMEEVEGIEIVPDYAYDKRTITYGKAYNKHGEERELKTVTYCLTHIPTGYLITTSDKVNTLKLMCAEPEFFDEFDVNNIIKAVGRFWNKHDWQEPKVS